MKPSTKIVWLRILHLIICLVIATLGPIFTNDFLRDIFDSYYLHKEDRLVTLFLFGVYVVVALIVLIIIHCSRGETTKFLIVMFIVSVVLTCLDISDIPYWCSLYAMLPLYWLVSWAFDKRINKLKSEIDK